MDEPDDTPGEADEESLPWPKRAGTLARWTVAVAGILGLVLAGFGTIVAIEKEDFDFVWKPFVVGAYLGGLFGFSLGLKTVFGEPALDRDDGDVSPKEIGKLAADNAAGVFIPGYSVLSLFFTFCSGISRLRWPDFTTQDAGRLRRAALEAVVWSVVPLGLIVGVSVVLWNASLLYALGIVPVIALVGALSGADSEVRLRKKRKV